MHTANKSRSKFVLCLDNSGNEVSLQVRRVYERLPDAKAERHGYIRVIDESGEGYMFPADRFLSLDLSRDVEAAIDDTVGAVH
jgi:hypothetical protein